ncbi:MAG: hypothetical protein KatS3mg131_3354 [Candidatus Tectimicrobiota bacterium]|nr:MAG: hypothetical protein KatS3mg131_3354 [Candidatus Tectomicrobia bacterium]
MLLEPAGDGLLAVSDHGWWMWGELVRDAQGVPRGLQKVSMAPILDIDGARLPPIGRDAEALTLVHSHLGPRVLVAFERWHRVWTYPLGRKPPVFVPTMLAAAQPLQLPEALLHHPPNGGLEAVTEIAPGVLVLFSEQARADDEALRAWVYELSSRRVTPFMLIPVEPGFSPTAAAVWQDCCLLVLQRRYHVIAGPAAAIVTIPLSALRPQARLKGRELVRLAPPLVVDNFEALAVEPGPDGTARLLLLSDDNYRRSQRTLLLTFAWERGPKAPAAHRPSFR